MMAGVANLLDGQAARGCIAPAPRRSRSVGGLRQPAPVLVGRRRARSISATSAARRRTGAGSSTRPAVRARSRSCAVALAYRASARGERGPVRVGGRHGLEEGLRLARGDRPGERGSVPSQRPRPRRGALAAARRSAAHRPPRCSRSPRERGLGIHAGHALLALGELELGRGPPGREPRVTLETLWHAGPGAGSRLGEALRSARPRRGGGPGRAARHRARGARVLRGLGRRARGRGSSCRSSSAAAGCWSPAPPRSSASRRRSALQRAGERPLRAGAHRARLTASSLPARAARAEARTRAPPRRPLETLRAARRGRPWAERAPAELRASGETARRRDPSTLDQLTPQELQIARVVAAGASNKQVAAQLFLSPRTIEFHLRHVFAKLGITSRSQLAGFNLDGGVDEQVAAATAAG